MSDEPDRLYEQLLVLRCQTGNEDAYRELVARFGPRLHYFLLKLVARADRAEDLAQETWIDVHRQLPRLKEAAAFTTWLYRIAYGKAMLDGRRSSREPVTTDVEGLAEKETEEPSFSPEQAAQIHAALDRLDAPYREVLVLRFLEELNYEEISEIVGCPVGTVRSRIHYAKARLQIFLIRDVE